MPMPHDAVRPKPCRWLIATTWWPICATRCKSSWIASVLTYPRSKQAAVRRNPLPRRCSRHWLCRGASRKTGSRPPPHRQRLCVSCQDFAQKGQGVTCLCEQAVVKGNLKGQTEERNHLRKSEEGGFLCDTITPVTEHEPGMRVGMPVFAC